MALTARTLPLADAPASVVSQWRVLAEASGVDLSMTPEWFAATVGARSMEGEARIFSLADGEKLIAVIPFVERSQSLLGVSMRSCECPGSFLVANHPELPASVEPEVALERFADERSRHCDMIVLPNLAKDGRTARAARGLRLAAVARPGHSSPYMSIAGSWDELVASKDKKFRYKIRNALKQLEQAGSVSEQRFERGADTTALLEQILHIEANSWKATTGMAVSGSEMETGYYGRLLPFLAARDALRANVLYLDSEPIAYSLAYVSQGAFRQLKTSYDERRASLSPGFAVMLSGIRRAFEAGASEFDFLGDPMPHKQQWATGVREHDTLFLFPLSLRGALVGRAASLIARFRSVRAEAARA